MSQSSSDEADSGYNLSDPDAECFLNDIEQAISETDNDSSNVSSDEDEVSDCNDSDDSNVKCSTRSKRAGNNVKRSQQGDKCLELRKKKKKNEN